MPQRPIHYNGMALSTPAQLFDTMAQEELAARPVKLTIKQALEAFSRHDVERYSFTPAGFLDKVNDAAKRHISDVVYGSPDYYARLLEGCLLDDTTIQPSSLWASVWNAGVARVRQLETA